MRDSSNTSPTGFTNDELYAMLDESIAPDINRLKKVLLLPPDFTRYHSMAGKITAHYYKLLTLKGVEVDVMPALGSHQPMTKDECEDMFLGVIPHEQLIEHSWRDDVVKIGEVPGEFVTDVSGGLVTDTIAVEVNERLLDPAYDLVLSIGQVVPHEVAGMANRSKNVFVGVGGNDMINKTHMLGAFCGLEQALGKDHSPVRRVFDYAEDNFLGNINLNYIMTVTTQDACGIYINGLFIGRERRFFEDAVALSQKLNIIAVEKPITKAVTYLDEREFKTTWVGNKAIYRTRMAISDGGELIVMAPGVAAYGEDSEIDRLIAKYGYCGRENVLKLVEQHDDLKRNLSAAAHLIHGSPDGRFSVTYCTKLMPREGVELIGYNYMPLNEALERYNPDALSPGWNTLEGGEEIYYIPNPAAGLWMAAGQSLTDCPVS